MKEGPQVQSLRQVGGLKGFNAPSPQPRMEAPSMHSGRSQQQSVHYHAKIMGQDPRLVDEMNPTKTLKASRSFPGLANGE
jgi:hypothetical protein